METTALTFGAPVWLWGLLVLPLLAFVYAWSHYRGRALVAKVVAPRLLGQLAGSVSIARRIFRAVLMIAVFALILISLAQPRLGFTQQEIKQKGRDIIVAVDTAVLVQAFANIGLVLDSGSSFFLPGLIGYNKAFELCTLGSKVTATEAHKLGIINKLVTAEELDAAVKEYADRYAAAAPKAMAIIKKMLNKALSSNLREMLQYEAYSQEIAGSTEDYKEGVTAFIEKRKAVFKGK